MRFFCVFKCIFIDLYYWFKLEYMNDELEKELSKILR